MPAARDPGALRHVPAGDQRAAAHEAKLAEVTGWLDELGVPNQAGRDVAAAALVTAGHSAPRELREALKVRQQRIGEFLGGPE